MFQTLEHLQKYCCQKYMHIIMQLVHLGSKNGGGGT